MLCSVPDDQDELHGMEFREGELFQDAGPCVGFHFARRRDCRFVYAWNAPCLTASVSLICDVVGGLRR